jgi:hypothetical protein
MTIRRGHVPAADHFTIVPNAWARDARLSFKARGLLTYLLSHREGWEITGVRELVKHASEGREAMTGAVRELEQHGYLVRSRARTESGRLSGIDYEVTDPSVAGNPVPGNPSSGEGGVAGKPVPGKPAAGKPATGFPATKKTTPLEDQREEDQQPPSTPAAAPPSDDDGALIPLPKTTPAKTRRRKAPGDSPGFTAFWEVYPRGDDKGDARKAWQAMGCEDIADVVIAGAIRYRDDPNRTDAYTRKPRTWLQGECWENGPLPPRMTPAGVRSGDQIVAETAASLTQLQTQPATGLTALIEGMAARRNGAPTAGQIGAGR